MKNFKIFDETQTANRLEKIIQPDKSFLGLQNKNVLTEIYRNIQTFAFQVLRKSNYLGSRNGAVQMVFLTPTRNMFAGTFVK